MFYSIDRISGNKACLIADNQAISEVPLEHILGNAKEGDIVVKQGEQYFVDEQETGNRRKNIQKMLNKLLHTEED